MTIKHTFTFTFGIGLALLISACSEASESSTRENATNGYDALAAFDPCQDIPPDFISEHGFDTPPRSFGPVAVVGPNKGKGCVYIAEGSYDVTIAVADAELGDATRYNKLVYDEYMVGGRPAEIARAQDRSDIGGSYVGTGSCVLNVAISGGLLVFHSENYPLSENAPEPCEKLTEIATEVVEMLPGE